MKYILSLFSSFLLLACGGNESSANQGAAPSDSTTTVVEYQNPVIRISAPDPTAIRVKDGTYYLYATEDIHNLPIFKSKDLVHWEEIGTAFTEETRPNFVDNNPEGKKAALWAPEIRYIKGKYVLFYSLAEWGNHWISTIGYAVSDSPEGPFTPKGKVFNSRDVDVENSIDQFFYEEDGKYYMLWGSFRSSKFHSTGAECNRQSGYHTESRNQAATGRKCLRSRQSMETQRLLLPVRFSRLLL